MGEARHRHWQRIRKRRRKLLWLAFTVAELMFFVKIGVGIAAMSVSLQLDALETTDSDDTSGGIFSQWHSKRFSMLATFFGGLFALVLCIWVVLMAIWNYLSDTVPHAGAIAAVGAASLIFNALILIVLHRDRGSSESMRSAWRSARNDAIGSAVVIAAAAGTYVTGRSWPDMVAAGAIMPFAIYQAVKAMRARL